MTKHEREVWRELVDAAEEAVDRIDRLNMGGPDMPDPTRDRLQAAIDKAKRATVKA